MEQLLALISTEEIVTAIGCSPKAGDRCELGRRGCAETLGGCWSSDTALPSCANSPNPAASRAERRRWELGHCVSTNCDTTESIGLNCIATAAALAPGISLDSSMELEDKERAEVRINPKERSLCMSYHCWGKPLPFTFCTHMHVANVNPSTDRFWDL